jgi:hypothetical protein
VSSLDHSRMQAVAQRLAVEAAAGRQVIIFTHNIVFHHMVENEARLAQVACHTEWMSGIGGTKFGVIDPLQRPPHTKKTKQRIAELTQAKDHLIKSGYDPSRPSEFRDPLISLYTRMRETWEQIIEEILFNGAVQRFRPEIMTQRLDEAAFDPETDYPEIFEGMTRCSQFSGHDRADYFPSSLPDVDTMQSDLLHLFTFSSRVQDRKRNLAKATSYEEGVQPQFL